jgi:hypothetical protein
MSRSILATTLSTVASLALGLPATGIGTGTGTGTADTGSAPALSAIVEQCVTATVQADRSVTFTGQMETVPGAHRMAIEIVVQERAPEEVGFHALTTAGLGSWQRSEAGLKIYKVRQAVTDLPAPAIFRAIVQYRWLNERGRVIRRDVRRTPVCRQPLERPKPGTVPAAKLRQA